MERSGRLRLSEVNQHLVCALCGGYFIDATTIVECLHSFCRSCLIKYLETNSFCPICDVQIHKAKPFLNIKPDKALQDIVYKLVPGLFHSEMRRRQEFYAKHPERMYETTPEGRGVGVERLIYSPDDSISLSLEYLEGEEENAGCASNHSSESENEGGVSRRYLQCPALVTIGHLKKFLRIKYELTPAFTVEVIHRREPLPDDYTLMDVAYIYTWKRSGPMRFFFRITHSGTGNSTISSVTTAVKDSSQASELPTTLSHIKPKSEDNDHRDNSKLLPQTQPPKPDSSLVTPPSELPRDSSSEINTKSSSKEHPATVSLSQSEPVVITKSMQSIPVPATVTSVSSTLTTCVVASSTQSPQTNSQATSSRSVTHPTTTAITKTITVTRTTPSPPSSTVPNVKMANSDLNVNEVTKKSADTVTIASVQQAPTVSNKTIPQKPVQVATSKPITKQPHINTEQSVSKPVTKEIAQSSSTNTNHISSQPASKETAQKIKSQISLQASASSNISQKTGQIPNGVSKIENGPPSPADVSYGFKDCKMQSQQEKPTIVCKNEHEETAFSSYKNKVLNEDNKSVSVPNTASGSSNTTKAVLSKHVHQRLHISGRKPSHPIKITSEASSTKAYPFVGKNQSVTTKESNKIRTNVKLMDKPVTAADNLISRKENPQTKSATVETANKEHNNVTTNSQKETQNSGNTLHPTVNNVANSTSNSNNNNNTKVPQQNQQIIRNNQQILKKNDEIMRCVPVKRPIQPIPRKTSDVLKNAVQHRDDDKTIAKKRRMTSTNPIKRPAINSSDVTKTDQLQQPVSKKSRPTVENNRKPFQSDQKSSQLKVRFPNPLTGQNNLCPTIKSESSAEISPNTLKNNANSSSNVSVHLSSSEFKSMEVNNQENVKNNVISERIQPNTTIQKPPSTSQINATSKTSIASTMHSAIKLEPHSTKSDMAHPPIRGSSQNMTSPPSPVVAHTNVNPRLCPTPRPPSQKGKTGVEPDGTGALDLSASPRRQPHPSILSIAHTLARRQQQHCPSPAPPLSPLSSLSPFPVIAGVPVRSPPPQLRIPVPHHRSSHSQQQRPSSLSSSSPSPPADTMPSSSRMGPPQQQQPPPPSPDMYASHLMSPATLMFRQQLELQRLLNAGKHNTPPGMEWYNDPNSIKRFENLMKSLQQQQSAGRNSPFYPYNNNNNAAAATNNYRK